MRGVRVFRGREGGHHAGKSQTVLRYLLMSSRFDAAVDDDVILYFLLGFHQADIFDILVYLVD